MPKTDPRQPDAKTAQAPKPQALNSASSVQTEVVAVTRQLARDVSADAGLVGFGAADADDGAASGAGVRITEGAHIVDVGFVAAGALGVGLLLQGSSGGRIRHWPRHSGCRRRCPRLGGRGLELLRIVRMLAQYFYPQRQTKVMNEGCATFCHYEIMNRMYEKGQVTEGSMLEFAHMHAAVVYQPGFNDKHYGGLNPYALGYAMMRDIKRICLEPSDEDMRWFPDIAGNQDPMGTLREAWANYRDESFVLQFLSPKVMRDFRLFHLKNDADNPAMRVEAIHDEQGYRKVRRMLARQYDVSTQDPDIQVTDADLAGSRRLVLTHFVRDGILLDKEECDRTLMHVARLWGYRVRLVEQDAASGRKIREHETLPLP